MPALLKGFFDRVLLPGFAFKYRDYPPFWDKLLKGKAARLIVTMYTPPCNFRFVFRRSGHNAMKRTIVGFCGASVKKIWTFSPIRNSKGW